MNIKNLILINKEEQLTSFREPQVVYQKFMVDVDCGNGVTARIQLDDKTIALIKEYAFEQAGSAVTDSCLKIEQQKSE